MMRSLYSAVSGLKTHQTRMDVIGNNIANVNTEAFKSSHVTFSEIMYQTTSGATAGNGAVGMGGKNAQQIGLGVSTGSTAVSITAAGSAETTGNPFDFKLTDSQSTNFFIVSDGTNRMFTRAGSFYVDGNGYLCMSSTGYTLQGWQVDPVSGEVRKDIVSPLQVMSPENQTSAPSATTEAYMSGVIDKNDANVTGESGYVVTLGLYDDLGYSYTAKFAIKPQYDNAGVAIDGQYNIALDDIIDSANKSILGDDVLAAYNRVNNTNLTMDQFKATLFGTDAGGKYVITYDANRGTFVNIGNQGVNADNVATSVINPAESLKLSTLSTLFRTVSQNQYSNFRDVEIDFSRTMNYDNSKTSTLKAVKGDTTGLGAGKKLGTLTGISVDSNGKIYGSYDNGNTVLLSQIAVAQFSNASGLEKVGDNCYQTTLNSGEFDGIGVDISADGSSISTGQLEMSNVDLSSEFTSMIITQRGFQANSRVITTSDTLLEELINLKR